MNEDIRRKDIDRIIEAANKDSRTVSSGMIRQLCDEVQRLRGLVGEARSAAWQQTAELAPSGDDYEDPVWKEAIEAWPWIKTGECP